MGSSPTSNLSTTAVLDTLTTEQPVSAPIAAAPAVGETTPAAGVALGGAMPAASLNGDQVRYRFSQVVPGRPTPVITELGRNHRIPVSDQLAAEAPLVTLRPSVKLGEGSFGCVYAVTPIIPDSIEVTLGELVVKQGKLRMPKASLEKEAEIFYQVNGGPVHLSFDEDRYLLVLPRVKGRTLSSCLHDASLDKLERLKMLDKVFERLKWLHAQGIYHGDLFPPNIMVHKNEEGEYQITFIDFGFSWLEGEPAVTCLADKEHHWHPDRKAQRVDLQSKPYYDTYTLCYTLSHDRKIEPFAEFCSSTIDYSVEEVRLGIQAEIARLSKATAEQRTVSAQLSLAKQVIFGVGEDSLSDRLPPEHFANHESLLAWLKAQRPGQFNQLSETLLGAIPLAKVRQHYRASLERFCLSTKKAGDPAIARQIRVARCASAEELKQSALIALPDQFKAASAEFLEQIISATKVAVIVNTVNAPRRLLLRTMLVVRTQEELTPCLARLADLDLRALVESLSEAEESAVWSGIQTTGLTASIAVVDRMEAAIKSPTYAVEKFNNETGFGVSTAADVNWEDWSARFKLKLVSRYRALFSLNYQMLRRMVKRVDKQTQIAFYKGQAALVKDCDDCVKLRSMTQQVYFSLVLAYAFDRYKLRQGINPRYKDYVYNKGEDHTLAGFCRQVKACCGRMGVLRKGSFAIFVLEFSHQSPWGFELLAPLLNSDEFKRIYQERLYLPLPDGRERRGGWLWKPASRVQRDKVLQAVKSFAPEGMVSAATPS